MELDELPILTEYITEGQPYIDEPITSKPAKRLLSPLSDALAEIFGYVYYVREERKCVPEGPDDSGVRSFNIRKRGDLPPEILLGYNHVKLRWMKPDGNGGLIPR